MCWQRRCLLQRKPKYVGKQIDGALQGPGVTSKDIILALIAQNGVEGGTGYVFEYAAAPFAPSRWKRV